MKGTGLAARRAPAAVSDAMTTWATTSSPSMPSAIRFPPLPQQQLLPPQTCSLAQSPFAAVSHARSRTHVLTAALTKERDGSPSFFGGVDELALAADAAPKIACRLVALVPSPSSSSSSQEAQNSPVAKGEASWLDVMLHEAVKVRWSDLRVEMKVVEVSSSEGGGGDEEAAFDAAVSRADALISVAFGSSSSSSCSMKAISLLSRPSAAAVRTLVPLGCEGADPRLLGLARVNGIPVFATTTTTTTTTTAAAAAAAAGANSPLPSRPFLARLPAFLDFSGARRAFDAFDNAASFWSRAHSDDALTALLVIADATGKVGNPPLAALDSLKGQGPGTLFCMIKNCRREVIDCVTDEGCKAALDCLTAAPPGDQVAAYRCIVSHESRLFEEFSLCVLSKHRCLGVSAEPPRLPKPRPQARWRGREMTHEVAEALFIGWRERRAEGGPEEASAFGDDDSLEPWSWRVAAGQNPAYDQFNCQYQVFYRGKGKGVLWYVPVFNVEPLSSPLGGGGGKEARRRRVWRKRKYRVKRGEVPGTFWFSVLDNGVVSKEFWTIISVADDLGFALFSYNGAASAAGQAYSGSVLCTREGGWPEERYTSQLDAALKEAGVKTWELFRVNNDACEGAPLEIEEG